MQGGNGSTGGFTREDSDFISQGTRCAGWLFRPEGASRPPIVIMAHGFGAERTFGLPAYVRIATRRPEENAQLLAALQHVRVTRG